MTGQPVTTKEKILEAAADIFGREGFKATTIRRIAESAQVNVAAINYHFRDKEGLYAAVLEHVFHTGFARFPSHGGIDDGMPPERQLYFFIRTMFYRLLSSEGWGGRHGKGRLIARELLDPSPAFESVLDAYIKPHKELLLSILVAISGRNPGPELLLPCAVSIIGQCLYYALAAPVIKRITGSDVPIETQLDRLSEFVWRFSLGGIAAIVSGVGAGSVPDPQPHSTPFSPLDEP
ncbi:CerR family C-terminal domain-containing protein [Desulfoprunum benzoelyticum]|uniref:AcrR family transcriptional regulator n=1 Tax=Desulfoprunum benzoelyticum TaxID=1506996 RepID=A0A840UZC1_9BACT|nr:CerR family C-terminal domain-containing protein [Desulfoprunum benzoelyticum]MBB5346799.1 AcrR family transcriptional regulator [Desulfoprunum benzoelyticum]MBM9531132.1 CerR family C-terminal domain-containing protein [Desulfoprunum benzoelyticum]